MRKIIDADWLYKKAADWEARAMMAVNQTMEYEDLTEQRNKVGDRELRKRCFLRNLP